MSMKEFEERVLSRTGARKRVAEIEDELRLAAGLTALREQAGLSQRDIAKLIGVSQPRVAAIEHSRNVTIEYSINTSMPSAGPLKSTWSRANTRSHSSAKHPRKRPDLPKERSGRPNQPERPAAREAVTPCAYLPPNPVRHLRGRVAPNIGMKADWCRGYALSY